MPAPTPNWISNARWVWLETYDDVEAEARFVNFRKTFHLTSVPQHSCLIHVSADTRYRLFINGQSISFGPCKSYSSAWTYETVDISPWCVQGDNVIAARVLRFSPSHLGSSSLMRAKRPGLLVHGSVMEIDLSTRSIWKCRQDDSRRIVPLSEWDYSFGPPFLRLQEEFDATREEIGWDKAPFDDGDWSVAVPQIAKQKMLPTVEPRRLSPRTIPILPETVTKFKGALKCEGDSEDSLERWNNLLQNGQEVSIPANSKQIVYIEADALTTGFVHFRFGTCHGAKVTILYSEGFEKPIDSSKGMFAREKGDRADHEKGILRGTEDFMTLSNHASEECYYEPFWFRTFRYLKLSVITNNSPLTVLSLTYRDTKYPLEIVTQVPFLRQPLAEIYKLSVNTLRNCMHETYEDCPYYEQNQFAFDSRLMMLYTYQLSSDDRLARKTIDEFAASADSSTGLLSTHFPAAYAVTTIPQFSLYWIMMLYDHMAYFGSQTLIRQYLPVADRILHYFSTLISASNGLVGPFPTDGTVWPFVDWVPSWTPPLSPTVSFLDMAVPQAYKDTGYATYTSCLYAYTLRHAAALFTFIKRHDTAAEYLARAQSVSDAINTCCYDATRRIYLDGPSPRPTSEASQHAQIFAVLSGACPTSLQQDLMRRTALNEDGAFAKASYAMQFYLFRALEAASGDLYAELFERLMQPWKEMLAMHLTTCPEADGMPRSDCHGWSACPVYEFVAGMLGVRTAEDGKSAVTKVAPRRELLGSEEGWARVCVAGRGMMEVKWDTKGGIQIVPGFDGFFQVGRGEGMAIVRARKGEVLSII